MLPCFPTMMSQLAPVMYCALLPHRTQEGVKRSMHLKDAMRETCLTDLAEAWLKLVRAYQFADPELAAAVLSTLERYVNWIDVGLVVNEQ